MKKKYYSVSYGASELLAVPAVHHHSAFADQVHSLCRDMETRPDAIAVELGAPMVAELIAFLKYLGQGGTKKKELPIMLGIMMKNRYIHTDYLEQALLLQEFYKSALDELPDEVLSERLNFNRWSTLLLSPADSIIEAVRCGIELNIPVYGVDLSDFANTKKPDIIFEDPHAAHPDHLEYSERVLEYCDAGRDPVIDYKREVYMAARLKDCLTNHKKVLFTCGMAHWKSIKSLLKNSEIPASPEIKEPISPEFRRVITHPALAAGSMEILPQMTFDHEQARCPLLTKPGIYGTQSVKSMVRECLDDIYASYTSGNKRKKPDSGAWTEIEVFERYLFDLTAVKQRKVPGMTQLIAAAEAIMNDRFYEMMIKRIMNTDPGWANPKDFPDLPFVSVPQQQNRHKSSSSKMTARFLPGTGSHNGVVKLDGQECLTDIPTYGFCNPEKIQTYWKWRGHQQKKNKSYYGGNPWIWPPAEHLIYGICFKAAEIGIINQSRYKQSAAFEGSLEGGIDIKSTIRSIIRNEKKIYVSKQISCEDLALIDGTNPDPFVLIYPETTEKNKGYWGFFTAGSYFENHVKDPELLRKVKREQGSIFVSSILLQDKKDAPAHLQSLVHDISTTYGTVMFGNPCINIRQSAIWLESSNYTCCPIITGYGMDRVLEYYQDRFGILIDLSDCNESLIRMAIPFAKKMVTILAPDGFKIPERAKKEAASSRISLNVVGFSNFSESMLDEARHRVSMYTLDGGGIEFPPEAEILLGQSKDAYFNMLPPAMRKQVDSND